MDKYKKTVVRINLLSKPGFVEFSYHRVLACGRRKKVFFLLLKGIHWELIFDTLIQGCVSGFVRH